MRKFINRNPKLKNIMRHTFLYRYYLDLAKERELRSWTPADEMHEAFYRQFVPQGSLTFDIGANFGDRTKVFRKLGARIIAVEPQKRCVRVLNRVYKNQQDTIILPVALAAQEGETDMVASDVTLVSSMSEEWIQKVQESGRMSRGLWHETITVQTTTLDRLIEHYGVPIFTKIDVEGYEYEVLKGLSRAVPCLSIEFMSEVIETTFKCLDHLEAISPIECNYVVKGPTMDMALPNWLRLDEFKADFTALCTRNKRAIDDIYIRMQ